MKNGSLVPHLPLVGREDARLPCEKGFLKYINSKMFHSVVQ